MTKKIILALVATIATIGLNAAEATVEKLGDHYSAEANKTDNPLIKEVAKGIDEKASKPTQRAKNLNEAVERLANGKASDADKEFIKSQDEPFIKKLQESTVYPFKVDITSQVYHTLSIGGASFPEVFAIIIDSYTIKNCTNDLTKMTFEDIKTAGVAREYAHLTYMKYQSLGTSKDSYKKYVQAVRAFNCGDQNAFRDYVDVELVDATVLTTYDTQKSAPQNMEFSFQNKKEIECHVFGDAYKFENGKFGIRVKKQKCGHDAEREVEGSVWPFIDNVENHLDTTFSSLNVGDKVKIFKTK